MIHFRLQTRSCSQVLMLEVLRCEPGYSVSCVCFQVKKMLLSGGPTVLQLAAKSGNNELCERLVKALRKELGPEQVQIISGQCY